MTKHELFKLVHLTAIIVWVGGGVLATIFTARAKKAEPAHKLGFARDMEFVSKRVFAPGAGIALLFGILMVLESEAIEFSQAWIVIGIAGILISMALGMSYLGPQATKLVAELATGDPAAEDRLNMISRVALVDVAILLSVIVVMIAKPGL